MSDAHTTHIQTISSLKNRADFLRLNKNGDKWVAKTLVLQSAPSTHDNGLCYGITVTKKTYKSAVKRNRIKRRLRALVRDILSDKAQHGFDYVLIGRPAALDAPYDALKKDLLWCLKKMDRHV